MVMNVSNMKNDLVSIIMLSHDGGKYVEETVSSVLAQTYQNWEIIFMDDSSKDDTISKMMYLMEEDKRSLSLSKGRDASADSATASATGRNESRIKVSQNIESKGAGESMNSALRDAKGKWIAFLNVGDIWGPNKLERQIAFMEENGYHFSYHKSQKINKDSKPIGGVISGKEHITFDDMLKCCWPSYHTVMYDAEKIGRLKTLNQRQENDYALWLQAAYKTDCYLLGECLAKHRANKWFYNPFPIGNNIEWRYEVYRKIEDLKPFVSAMYTIRNICYGIWKKIKYVER